MSIQPITSTSINFQGIKTTKEGNTYHTSNSGKIGGLAVGTILAGALIFTQARSLNTFKGKRLLLETIHEGGKELNDIMPRVIKRNAEGKIIPPEGGRSERSKKIACDFVKSLSVWGAGIMAATTAIGALIDKNSNLSNSRIADGYMKF